MNDGIIAGGTAPFRDGGVYIYPGSFDPVTFGHLDILTRAACMCGRLIIAVGQNRGKAAMFSVGERMEMLRDVVAPIERDIEVASFGGLLADYAKKRGASVIVKGLRAMSDFEYEFQMALLNKYLDDRLETIFLMTGVQYTYLSSSAVKEIAVNGGSLEGLVPGCVVERIQKKALELRGIR